MRDSTIAVSTSALPQLVLDLPHEVSHENVLRSLGNAKTLQEFYDFGPQKIFSESCVTQLLHQTIVTKNI